MKVSPEVILSYSVDEQCITISEGTKCSFVANSQFVTILDSDLVTNECFGQDSGPPTSRTHPLTSFGPDISFFTHFWDTDSISIFNSLT